jgi:predicted GNAT family acetyltransferase
MWQVLSHHWNHPRGIRPDQRLLVAEHAPAVPMDARLRSIRSDELEAYLAASVAMFTEELGVSPAAGSGLAGYRRRIDWLISSHRAFGIVDADGRIAVKTDLGAVSEHTCQLQGVWVRPDLRGQGLGTAAVAAVIAHALTIAPTVSLYVNEYNVAARRLYARLGMREVATMATVLL